MTTLAEALVVIGVEALTRMVFAVGTRDLLSPVLHRYPLAGDEFWKHGLVCGVVARALARHAGAGCGLMPDEALLAGLLHDVGKRPLDPLLDRRRGRRPVSREEERRTAGIDHAAVSGLICRRWELPEPVTLAVAGHHDPTPAPPGALVALGDAIAHRHRRDLALDAPLPPGAWARWRGSLDLSSDDLGALLSSLRPVLLGIDEMMRRVGHDGVPPDREPAATADWLNPLRRRPASGGEDR